MRNWKKKAVYCAKTVIFLRNNTKLVKKCRLLSENGNLSQKQYEISKKNAVYCVKLVIFLRNNAKLVKKCRLLSENGNLSGKQYEIGKKMPFVERKR